MIINEQPVYRIVCTKDHLRELVTGNRVFFSKEQGNPTAESVELAEEYNLKLICKAWPDQCEIFADY